MTFVPSPQLAIAASAALRAMALHRPRVGAFRTFLQGGADGDAILRAWSRALLGVSLVAIPEAAERWVATKGEIPTPATFAKFARAIDNAEYRFRDRLDAPAMQTAHTKSDDRSTALSNRAYAQLHDWNAVGLVWELCANASGGVNNVRNGDVSDLAFGNALQTVLQNRERQHLAETVSAA